MIAAASSAECAKHTFLQKTFEYFHRGLQVEVIDDEGGLMQSACGRGFRSQPWT